LKCQWKDKHKKILEQYKPHPLIQHPCFAKKKSTKHYDVSPEQSAQIDEILQKSLQEGALFKDR